MDEKLADLKRRVDSHGYLLEVTPRMVAEAILDRPRLSAKQHDRNCMIRAMDYNGFDGAEIARALDIHTSEVHRVLRRHDRPGTAPSASTRSRASATSATPQSDR